MAYLRHPSSDGAGNSYLRILVDGLGTNSYDSIIIYNATTGQSYYASVEGGTTGNYRSTTQTFGGLDAGTSYRFYAEATPSGSFARRIPESGYDTFTTTGTAPDKTPPTLNIASTVVGLTTIEVHYTAGDDKGMRPSNTYQLEISGANNSTYASKGYTSASNYTFSSDGAGKAFVKDATYNIRVTAYDSSNNATAKTTSVVFKVTKPTAFSWDSTKNVGAPFNITAVEWNALGTKINAFRAYKGLPSKSFSPASSKAVFLATMFNAFAEGIREMNPSVSAPLANKSKDTPILANDINRLVSSVNSVT